MFVRGDKYPILLVGPTKQLPAQSNDGHQSEVYSRYLIFVSDISIVDLE